MKGSLNSEKFYNINIDGKSSVRKTPGEEIRDIIRFSGYLHHIGKIKVETDYYG